LFQRSFILRNGALKGRNGPHHFLWQQDALGLVGFADNVQHLAPVGFQHDQVTGYFGFEFVQHVQTNAFRRPGGFMIRLSMNQTSAIYRLPGDRQWQIYTFDVNIP
jgi:hypothetical protein